MRAAPARCAAAPINDSHPSHYKRYHIEPYENPRAPVNPRDRMSRTRQLSARRLSRTQAPQRHLEHLEKTRISSSAHSLRTDGIACAKIPVLRTGEPRLRRSQAAVRGIMREDLRNAHRGPPGSMAHRDSSISTSIFRTVARQAEAARSRGRAALRRQAHASASCRNWPAVQKTLSIRGVIGAFRNCQV